MSYIDGVSRDQTTLFPDSLDDFVAADQPVRVIDAFVDGLDVAALGFAGSTDELMGRPRYRPQDLLKLYVYGYLNQIRSSRRLERECHRNVELMWLLGRLAPDFKTIADFRKDNGVALKRTCRAFVMFCNDVGLIGEEIAIDGSKFQAAASKDQVVTRAQLAKRRAVIEQRIEAYLSALDDADQRQELGLNPTQVEAALDHLHHERAQLAVDEEAINRAGKSQHCRTEPDARLMRAGRGGMVLGYNVQTSVDTDHKLIVHHAVSQSSSDGGQLYPMARTTQQVLRRNTLTVLADAGYSSGHQLQRCDDHGIDALVPANRAINHQNQGRHYQKAAFTYIEAEDEYRCPAGERLTYATCRTKDRLHLYTTQACADCAHKPRCTTGKQRWISRHFNEAAFARNEQRLAADPWAMTRRKASVEAPFGTLKRQMGDGRFLCRGLRSVKAEIALSTLAYNLKRVLNLIGIEVLTKRLVPG